MTVHKCAVGGCYAQVDERGARCDEHTGVEYVSGKDYARLARLLSPAELRDYIGVEVHDNGVREWARKVDKPHQNVSRSLSSAREKLESERMNETSVPEQNAREEAYHGAKNGSGVQVECPDCGTEHLTNSWALEQSSNYEKCADCRYDLPEGHPK